MARAVERIEQDLATLEEAIARLRAEFYSSYSQYLTLLGQAVRQQLILASYQVCTQGYPDSFLSLSFNQRQTLQQSLRQLGGKAREQLLSHLEQSKKVTETEATGEPDDDDDDDDDDDEPTPDPLPVNSESLQVPAPDHLPNPSELSPDSDTSPEDALGSDSPPEDALDSDSPPEDDSETAELVKTPPTPSEQLAQWLEQLEEAIAQTLQTTSLEANRLLQQSGIIPNKLPSAVLEAAAKVEASTETTPGAPNLLNLLMETESNGDSENSTLTRIVAINLRLLEIEFADPALSAARNQIRNLSAKGSKLQRHYHKKQRERAVARAEAAWRASWFED